MKRRWVYLIGVIHKTRGHIFLDIFEPLPAFPQLSMCIMYALMPHIKNFNPNVSKGVKDIVFDHSNYLIYTRSNTATLLVAILCKQLKYST